MYTQAQITEHRSGRASPYVLCPLHGAGVLAGDKRGSYGQDRSAATRCHECPGRCQAEHLALARPHKLDESLIHAAVRRCHLLLRVWWLKQGLAAPSGRMRANSPAPAVVHPGRIGDGCHQPRGAHRSRAAARVCSEGCACTARLTDPKSATTAHRAACFNHVLRARKTRGSFAPCEG